MLFNSYTFVFLFMPIVWALWWGLSRWSNLRLLILVAASFLFYGWWNWRFTALLAASTLLDYVVGIAIASSQRTAARRGWLAVSLIGNLGMLGYFKYAGFLSESFDAIAQWLQLGGPMPVVHVLLPVGISFFTFQTLSYSIDIYRRQVQPARSVLHFCAYVSMFPQLVAGPIVRYSDVETQLRTLPLRPQSDAMMRGLWFFIVGLFQKVLVADIIARLAAPLSAGLMGGGLSGSTGMEMSTLVAWTTLIAFSTQLYFDFAGYSNMAIGLGWLLGFPFPQNFDSPYQATDIQSFWRRWHMSLSTFLRDYLYFPLGGSRGGIWMTVRNLWIVMLLGGIWHGAGWTFVLWGAYHGALLAGHALWRYFLTDRNEHANDRAKLAANTRRETATVFASVPTASRWQIPKLVATAITFVAVIWGWVLFKSPSISIAYQWYASLLGSDGLGLSMSSLRAMIPLWSVLSLSLAAIWFLPNVWRMSIPRTLPMAVLTAIVLAVCILRFDSESPFLYFQF
jgi:alginate O-acetyltransferase complex protein AlgI